MRKLVDMSREPVEKKLKEKIADIAMPTEPLYPYGLCLSFDSQTCEKLDLSEDCEVGDMIDLRAFGKVTNKSINDRIDADGKVQKDCRIEVQLTHVAVEDESTEEPADY